MVAAKDGISRLIIDKMVLENFKSYAGRQEIGPFHSSFSAVVGPNGSGKSNVIDALLFVFGYRASKLRQPKASDLVHFSEAFPNADKCSVSIHFVRVTTQSDDGEANLVPDSETMVERVAYKKDGHSDYYLNGRPSTASEVIDYLKAEGIDLSHHRFLILQGEVESIALMKPKATNEHEDGLLEYLEEMIGTNRYKPLIENALASLEEASEASHRQKHTLRHLEKEQAAIEASKRDVEAFLQAENEMNMKKSFYLQLSKYEIEKESETKMEQKEMLVKQMNELMGSLSTATNELRVLESESPLTRELEIKMEEEKKCLQENQKAELRLQESIKHLKSRLSKTNKAMGESKSELVEQESLLAGLKEEMETKQKSLSKLTIEHEKAEIELGRLREKLKGKTDAIQQKIVTLQEKLNPIMDQVQEKRSRMAMLQLELDQLSKQAKESEAAVGKAMSDVTELTSLLSNKTAECKGKKKEQVGIESELEELKTNTKTLAKLKCGLEEKATGLKASIMELKSQQTQQGPTHSHLLDALMKESQIEGVFGRLGDLGSVQQVYEVALHAATGSLLDHVVVRNTETAQRCVDYLKRFQLGRATFILLDKMMAAVPLSISIPKDSQRLYDLIQPIRTEFAPAFYFALRDTLVTRTLEEANSVAFHGTDGRFRVVTLDGKLIDKSGAMSGGGSPLNTTGILKMRGSSTLQDVRAMETELRGCLDKLEETRQVSREVDLRIECIEKSHLPSVSFEASKLAQEVANLEIKLKNSKIQLQEANKMSSTSRVTAEDQQVQKLQLEADALEATTRPIRSQIESEEERILELGGVAYRTQSSLVADLKEQIDSTSARLTKLDQQSKKTVNKIAQLSLDLSTCEALSIQTEMQECNAQLALIGEQQTAKQADLNALLALKEEAAEAAVERRKTMSKLQKRVYSFENKRVDLNHSLSTLDDQLAKNKTQVHSISQELALLVVVLTEEVSVSQLAEHIGKRDRLGRELSLLQQKLDQKKTDLPSMTVIEEHARLTSAISVTANECALLESTCESKRQDWESLKSARLDQFLTGFQRISLFLKEIYQLITAGGNAELELVDSLDPFSEGVLFSVMPPKKSWKHIGQLSGGEKTLSSLALVFALHRYAPTPFYVMDEIDAALDTRNVSIIAHYIRERTKGNAQFIVVSLCSNMFELAGRLVGIYKGLSTHTVLLDPERVSIQWKTENKENNPNPNPIIS